MARNPVQQYLDASATFTGLTRDKAEQIVKDLVKAGEIRRKQAAEAVDELIERSRSNAEALVAMVQTEVRNQLAVLDAVSKDAVSRLEEQVEGLRKQVQELLPDGVARLAPARRTPVRSSSPTPAKRAPAKKKAAAKRAPAKKKAATKRAPAKKKSAAKRAPAKKAAG